MKMGKYDYCIIGAGLAGLSLAHQINKKSKSILVLEKMPRVGGVFESKHYKNSIYEWGPNTVLSNNTYLNQLIKELDLEESLISSLMKDSTRYLFMDHKLKKVPSNPVAFLGSELLSAQAKLEIFTEIFKGKCSETKNKSVKEYLSERFGEEVSSNLIANFLQGIWGGDYRKLCAESVLKKLMPLEKKHGSIILGAIKESFKKKSKSKKALSILSFKDGLSEFTERLADKLNVKTNSEVKKISLESSPSSAIKIEYFNNGESHCIEANKLIIATKAAEAAELLSLTENCNNELVNSLQSIEYAPMALIAYTIPKKLFKQKLSGFGFLFANEKHRANENHQKRLSLGTIWSSELFPERELEDEYLFSCFLGGATNKQILDLSENEIKEIAINDQIAALQQLSHRALNINDFNIIDYQLIKEAIPQYNIGHKAKVKQIQSQLKNYGNIELTGNYLEGISIPDTLELSLQLSDKITS